MKQEKKIEIRNLDNANSMKMLSQGNTAEIYEYNEGKVLKLFREGMPDEAITMEFQQVCKIQSEVDNIPKAFEIVRVGKRLGIVYEEVRGIDMIKAMFASGTQIKDYAIKLAHYHVDIHTHKVDTGRSVKRKLANEINITALLNPEEKQELQRHLEKLPEGKTLCHMDFHPGNVMLKEDKPIIIDWMTACTGTPAADVARTCLLMNYGEINYGVWILRKILGRVQHYIGRVYRKEYQKITNMTDEEIEQWMLPLAAARLVEWLSDHEKKKLVHFFKTSLKGKGN